MNKISSTLLAFCLMCTGSLTFAMDSMDKDGAMEKGAMSQDAMKNEPMDKAGAMMKAQPKKMKKQDNKMAQDGKIEQGGSMPMEPAK